MVKIGLVIDKNVAFVVVAMVAVVVHVVVFIVVVDPTNLHLKFG